MTDGQTRGIPYVTSGSFAGSDAAGIVEISEKTGVIAVSDVITCGTYSYTVSGIARFDTGLDPAGQLPQLVNGTFVHLSDDTELAGNRTVPVTIALFDGTEASTAPKVEISNCVTHAPNATSNNQT